MISQAGDTLTLTADVSPTAIKRAPVGSRRRILVHEEKQITNSDGKQLYVTIKVTTKPAPQGVRAPGYGLTGREMGDTAPHRIEGKEW